MGTFKRGEVKVRPGVYHRYENSGGSRVAEARNGIGAGLITAKWGPLNQIVEMDPTSDVGAIFGTGGTEDLITEMFTGGISSGKFVRIGSGGSQPSIKIKTDEETDAITITGAYVGSRPLSVSVKESITGDSNEFTIYEGSTVVLSVNFEIAEDEVPVLVAAINKATKEFGAKAEPEASGKIKKIAQQPMTGGTDPEVSVTEYSKGLSVLESTAFNCMAVDSDKAEVHALVNSFLTRTYTAGAYPMACVAENKEVDLDTRITHAAAYNNEMMHLVLNPAYGVSGDLIDGYRLAARIAGMIASVPSNASLTHQIVSGFASLAEPLTNTQIEKALKKGCLVLTENSNSQVWIEQGINTLITPNSEQDEGFKKIRRVKTRFELMQRIDDTLEVLIGKVNNDTDGRAALIASAQAVIDIMVSEKKLLPGGTFSEDSTQVSEGDYAYFVIAVDDIDSIEKVYLDYKFRFSQTS